MEGSTSIRLRAYLKRTGTQQQWLAQQLGVNRAHLHNWLTGRQPVPRERQHEILRVLRQRQLERIPRDLFDHDQEADGHGHDHGQ